MLYTVELVRWVGNTRVVVESRRVRWAEVNRLCHLNCGWVLSDADIAALGVR